MEIKVEVTMRKMAIYYLRKFHLVLIKKYGGNVVKDMNGKLLLVAVLVQMEEDVIVRIVQTKKYWLVIMI